MLGAGTLPAVAVLLVCADPLRPRRPDPHFAEDAAAARACGATVALVDHDALCRGDTAAALRFGPEDLGTAWYRGWMVTAGQYAALAEATAQRGLTMATDAAAYRAAHELPGWYDAFRDVTARSVWLPWSGVPADMTPARWGELVALLGAGAAVVKDYVKSCKDAWDEACYVPDLADLEQGRKVVVRMAALRGDALVGGVVVRVFEPYVGDDKGAHECRIWWVDGVPVLTGPHPDRPEDRFTAGEPDEIGHIAAAARALGCRFVTTDVARHAGDGRWRVVEVGDGQVSDLPAGTSRHALIEPLLTALG